MVHDISKVGKRTGSLKIDHLKSTTLKKSARGHTEAALGPNPRHLGFNPRFLYPPEPNSSIHLTAQSICLLLFLLHRLPMALHEC
jgi:hypothetical protein